MSQQKITTICSTYAAEPPLQLQGRRNAKGQEDWSKTNKVLDLNFLILSRPDKLTDAAEKQAKITEWIKSELSELVSESAKNNNNLFDLRRRAAGPFRVIGTRPNQFLLDTYINPYLITNHYSRQIKLKHCKNAGELNIPHAFTSTVAIN